jgi:hypothetical protein
MNRVVTTDASITAGQPIVANAGLGTLPFIQDSFQESMANMVKGILGTYTPNDLIVLIDPQIVISGGGSNTATWTKGAFFYNDEIYTIAAGTITKSSGVFLFVISDVQSPVLDPIFFKDNSQHGPHRVRQITISSGTSGTGIADYGGATVKNYNPAWVSISLINGWVADGTSIPQYKLFLNGHVRLRGRLITNAASNIIFAVTPTLIRPTYFKLFPPGYNDLSGGLSSPLGLSIDNGGTNMKIDGITPLTTIGGIALDGVEYDLN